MVEFTRATVTSRGAPVQVKRAVCDSIVLNGAWEITPQNHVNKSVHPKCNYNLPPSVMGSLNGPVPLTLTAATWKAYSVFGVRPSMMSPVVTTDLCHTSLSVLQVV